MTIEDLVQVLSLRPVYLAVYFILLPLLSFILGNVHGAGKGCESPYKYIYSTLIYGSCVPGMFSSVLTGYTLFFISDNLFKVNLLIYFLPIVSMIITIVIIKKQVNLDGVPGFDRLLGLMTILAVTFLLALMIMKTRIWLVFGSSLGTLVILVMFLFALLKWGSSMIARGSGEAKVEPPKFPGLQ